MSRRHMLGIVLVLCCAYLTVHPVRAAIVMGDVEPADPSTWTSNTRAYVGNTASGTLTIDSGAYSSAYGYIGNNSGATGVVNISGADSVWSNEYYFYVGNSGSGTLNISNGGSLNASVVTVGA